MKAFDIPTDGKIYEILTVHGNDFVDIKEVGGAGIGLRSMLPVKVIIKYLIKLGF